MTDDLIHPVPPLCDGCGKDLAEDSLEPWRDSWLCPDCYDRLPPNDGVEPA